MNISKERPVESSYPTFVNSNGGGGTLGDILGESLAAHKSSVDLLSKDESDDAPDDQEAAVDEEITEEAPIDEPEDVQDDQEAAVDEEITEEAPIDEPEDVPDDQEAAVDEEITEEAPIDEPEDVQDDQEAAAGEEIVEEAPPEEPDDEDQVDNEKKDDDAS
jgi:hypothetical protein